MGIQLDWQIESEQQQRRATEDPSARQARRRQWRLLLGTIIVVTCLVGVVGGLVFWRLQQYDQQLREALIDTVDAEIRALRVGDESAYMAIRRTSSHYWLGQQAELFAEYQSLKASGLLELTGEIVDLDIDQNTERKRARVLLEERIGDQTYLVAWFYWYYESEPSGWRRLPPDTEYWGDAATLESDQARVEYFGLDEPLAKAIFNEVDKWWLRGCELLDCIIALPQLKIQITPRPAAPPEWDVSNEWAILVASPLYDGRMNRDNPLSPELSQQLALLIAERLVDYNLSPTANFDSPLVAHQTTTYADAMWLRSEFVSWLQGAFLGIEGSGFLNSFARLYGDIAPPLLLRLMTVDTPLGTVLESVSGLNVASMPLDILSQIDWRAYFAFRLNFETRLLRGEFEVGDEQQLIARYNTLYDETDANALAIADTNRRNFDAQRPLFMANSVNIVLDAFGRPQATVEVVSYPELPSQYVVFRWDGFTWKRVG